MSGDFRGGFILGALVAALACYAVKSYADTALVATLASYHFDREEAKKKDYCEVNPGVGFEHGISERVRLVAGMYQSSWCKTASYAGASVVTNHWRGLRAGLALVAFTGYEKTTKDSREDKAIVVPLLVLSYERERYGLNVIVIPPHEDSKGALGFQAKVLRW